MKFILISFKILKNLSVQLKSEPPVMVNTAPCWLNERIALLLNDVISRLLRTRSQTHNEFY